MKRIITLIFLILCIITLAGCGGAGYSGGGSDEASYRAYDNGGLMSETTKYNAMAEAWDYDDEYYEVNYLYEVNDVPKAETPESRKIIKNANVECSADNVSEKYQTVLSWLKENNGYEFSQIKTVRDEYCTIEAVFKITPEKLDTFIDVIGKNTEIINLHISANDITENYYDTQLRLKSKKAALDQYYVMMNKAVTVDEILKIQQVINEYTAEIESMEGKLIFWDKQVSESTVTVSFYQTNDPSKPRPVSFKAMPFDDMTGYIGSGFMSVINMLFAITQWLLITLISISPLAVIALVIIFIIRYIKKNKNKKSSNM